VDSVWKWEKLEAAQKAKKRADSHLSGARCVSPVSGLEETISSTTFHYFSTNGFLDQHKYGLVDQSATLSMFTLLYDEVIAGNSFITSTTTFYLASFWCERRTVAH
jgi:hypothetical protein